MAASLVNKRERLIQTIMSYGSCAVAFSGGVDSAVVAKAAVLAVGDAAIAITGTSHSLASGELAWARDTALRIGIRHHVLATDEFDNPDYVRNEPDRCFHCKTQLYEKIAQLSTEFGFDAILNGANLEDLGDYRPGLKAAAQFNVFSPLADCQIDKSDVRQLAADWQLPVWDKPAAPCLSSRVAYGQSVTPARLQMIDQAERFLRDHDFSFVRVRYHAGDVARIEVAPEQISRLTAPEMGSAISARLQQLGFRFVTVDLQGFRSGSLNALITVDQLKTLADNA